MNLARPLPHTLCRVIRQCSYTRIWCRHLEADVTIWYESKSNLRRSGISPNRAVYVKFMPSTKMYSLPIATNSRPTAPMKSLCTVHYANSVFFPFSGNFGTLRWINVPQNQILPGAIGQSSIRELHNSSSHHSKERPESTKHPLEQDDKVSMKENVWTVPNGLTISRIVLTPVLGYMVLQQYYVLACGMFIYAGITDMLDGYIARRYPSQASMFGSYLDPLADKLLISVLYVTLTAVGLLPVPLTALVLARDTSLICAAFYVRYISLTPPRSLAQYFDVTHATAQLHPTLISKVNTAVQLALVAATLAAPVFGFIDHIALQTLWYVTAATTFTSGLTYMFAKDTFRLLQDAKKSRHQGAPQAADHQGAPQAAKQDNTHRDKQS